MQVLVPIELKREYLMFVLRFLFVVIPYEICTLALYAYPWWRGLTLQELQSWRTPLILLVSCDQKGRV